MPSTNREAVPRREFYVFYILDTSKSMEGQRIAQLNRAMEETLDALKGVANGNNETNINIAVLEFNSNARWITRNGPERLDDFLWEKLTAGGTTDIGLALRELDAKLSRNKFLKNMNGAYLPVFIFMTDGYPSDEYQHDLDKIQMNSWFKKGKKIGIAVGDGASREMLANICGTDEAVIATTDLEEFRKLMVMVSVTSSMLQGRSRTRSDDQSGAEIARMAADSVRKDDETEDNTDDIDSYEEGADGNDYEDRGGISEQSLDASPIPADSPDGSVPNSSLMDWDPEKDADEFE